jgi:hypothetical protein
MIVSGFIERRRVHLDEMRNERISKSKALVRIFSPQLPSPSPSPPTQLPSPSPPTHLPQKIHLECGNTLPLGKFSKSALQGYRDFWDDNMRFRKGWETPTFTYDDVEPLLRHAAMLVGRIRSTFVGQVAWIVTGTAIAFLWEVTRGTRTVDPRVDFVYALVHRTFKDGRGYIADVGGSAEQLDAKIAAVYRSIHCVTVNGGDLTNAT